jgi:hypothetical protein
MKKITIVCHLIAEDDFSERDIKAMLDASDKVKHAEMHVKIEQTGGGDDGVQHSNKRW